MNLFRIPLCLMVLLSWWAAAGVVGSDSVSRLPGYGIGSGSAPAVPLWLDGGQGRSIASGPRENRAGGGDGSGDGLVSTPLIARVGAVGWRGVPTGPDLVWSDERGWTRSTRGPPRG